MKTKIPFILCILYPCFLGAQVPPVTSGIFSFTEKINIPDRYEIGPGQLTKDGAHFIIGLLQGDFSEEVNMESNIFLAGTSAGDTSLINLGLPNAPDSIRYFQCSASDHEKILVFVTNPYTGWAQNELGISEMQPDGSYSNVRVLDEVNDTAVSDAYPWISGDGLRLYYSHDFRLFQTQRTATGNRFEKPVPVAFTGDIQIDIVSCWLTQDEKTIFFIANNTIYRAYRKSITEPFSFPQVMTDEFKNFYFISGISFSPAGKDLYLYYSDETTQSILKYHLKKGKAW